MVTGATGKLGGAVINALLARVDVKRVVALALVFFGGTVPSGNRRIALTAAWNWRMARPCCLAGPALRAANTCSTLVRRIRSMS